MRYLLILSFLAAITFPAVLQSQTDLFAELNSLYKNNRYFKLHSSYQSGKSNLEEWQSFYFDALIQSLFNKPEDSNMKIGRLLSDYSAALSDSSRNELYKAMLVNYINLFDYKNSLGTTEFMLANFPALIDSADKKEYLNSLKIWTAAKDLKHKEVIITGESRVPVSRDLAGYVNVPLNVNGHEVEFIFDTGANLSTVSRTYALRLKLKMLEGEIDVGTSTDKTVKTNLAYADSVNIGKFTCYNVLFLVVDDELLSFAGGLYVIDGIVGHPIIKEMGEMRLSDEDLLIPSTPGRKELKNFVLEGLSPIVNVVYGKDTLEFSFDTGARSTVLYFPFFERYKETIMKKYEPEEITIEGAGGEMKYNGYIIDRVNLGVGDSKTKLENLKLLAEPFKRKNGKNYYGNLGQDFIKQFKTLIINFESMYIEFAK